MQKHRGGEASLSPKQAVRVNPMDMGMTPAQIVAEYPDLEEEDIRQRWHTQPPSPIEENQVYPLHHASREFAKGDRASYNPRIDTLGL